MGVEIMDEPSSRERLAQLMQDRRKEMRLSIRAAAQLADIDRDTWTSAETARRKTAEHHYRGIERALAWESGSIEAILAGGHPVDSSANWTVTKVSSVPDLNLVPPQQGPSDDADIELVMDSDLPEDEKHRIVRELLAERADDRRRRLERARRYVDLYRRASGD